MSDRSERSSRSSQRKNQHQISAWRLLVTQIVGLIRQFGSTLIWAGVVVYLIQVAGTTIRAFAGQTSIANLVVALAGHLSIRIAVTVSLAGVTGALWGLEYRRHRKTRERLTKRITYLETLIDPKRLSSKLTSEGTTRIGDL